MRPWQKSILAAAAPISATAALWLVTIQIAWNTGSWVGASTPIPTKATAIAQIPSAAALAAAIILAPFAIKRRSPTTITAAITALLTSIILAIFTAIVLAFGSIT